MVIAFNRKVLTVKKLMHKLSRIHLPILSMFCIHFYSINSRKKNYFIHFSKFVLNTAVIQYSIVFGVFLNL